MYILFQETKYMDISTASTVNNECLCPKDLQHSIALEFLPSGEKLKITFSGFDTRHTNAETFRMGAVLDFQPSKHFKDVNDTRIFEASLPADTDIGNKAQSYVCNAAQVMMFTDYSVEGTMYHISLDVSKLHVQAYNVQSGSFSDNGM